MPDSRQSRLQLEETVLRPLRSYLIRELGFNPLISDAENIRIDQQRIAVDAGEYYRCAVEGLKLLSLGQYYAARQELARAKSIYAGSYLPGMDGSMITNTRNELESIYRQVVLESARQAAADSGRGLMPTAAAVVS